MNLVTDDMVSAALQYLSQNTMAAAEAKAARIMAEHTRKTERARLFLIAPEGPIAAKEAWAESHSDYVTACRNEAEAAKVDEYHRAARTKADAIIEAWRTESATIRAAEKIR